jgi:hypothetical protein
MAAVSILNVTVLDNPTAFVNPLQFEIQFECLQALDEGTYPMHQQMPTVMPPYLTILFSLLIDCRSRMEAYLRRKRGG